MKNFEGLGLCDALKTSLSKMDFNTPTPIQAKAIPLALEGRDILGSAQTGTGKTGAFSIPMVEALHRDPSAHALILTPTRELAKQVLEAVKQILGSQSDIRTAFIIGGEQMHKQNKQLQARPRIVVGTPGRINDHLRRGSLDLDQTGFLVLDETDRMLDMGFGVQLDEIVKHLPRERQTLMFSATLPKGIIQISDKYLTNPQRISVGETNVLAKNIKQEALRIEQGDKYPELKNQLHEREGSVIIFVKTKYNADKMAKRLREDGFTADALHGDLRQNKRDKVMKNFREKNMRILVATDIAARGLDVPHIEHVVNYDLPQVAEDYIHRMGRTARAGAEGSAISFVASQDSRKWHAIECLLDPNKKPERPASNGKGRKPRRSGGKPGGYAGKSSQRPAGAQGRSSDKPFKQKFSQDGGDKPKYAKNDRGDRTEGGKSKRTTRSEGGKPKFAGEKKAAQGKSKYSGDNEYFDKKSGAGKPKKKFSGDKPYGAKKGKPSGQKGNKPSGNTFGNLPPKKKSGGKSKPHQHKAA